MLQTVQIKPGDRIKLSSGTYQIEDEIGAGGFATVYKGIREGDCYAIKLNRIWELLPDDREDLKKRIRLEYEISSGILSEHIVHAFSYDEINENPVLVMEYCPDGSLRKKIGKHLGDDELTKIIVQILSGLNILHSHEIIHRDIKPENILFKNNRALLTDFGISANLKNRVTQRNIRGHALKIFATLSYSPPEQSQKNIAFKSTGPTNDIFSFGVIMFEMITEGKLPFGDFEEFNEDSEIVEKRKAQGVWKSEVLKKHTGNKTWIEIIERCLQPDPKMRFQSTNEILQRVGALMPGTINTGADWKLRVLGGPDAGKEFNITHLSRVMKKKILTIGRFNEINPPINDIPINEGSSSYISLHHGSLECIIKNETSSWYIRDGQWCSKDGQKGWHLSRNGIKVNSMPVDRFGVEIHNNDQIEIGKLVLLVTCG